MDPNADTRAEWWLQKLRYWVPATLLAVSLLNWWQTRGLLEQTKRTAEAASQAWVKQPPRFPLEALNQAWIVPASPNALRVFDPGDGPWLGTSFYLQLGRLARAQDHIAYDYFAAGRQIEASPALLLQLWIPLLALLMAWRDRGEAGRGFLAQVVEILERIGPGLAVSLVAVGGLGAPYLGGEGATRLLLLLAVYLLYAVAAMGISRLGFQCFRSRELAMVVVTFFWLVNLSLARPLTVNLAGAWQRLPSLEELIRLLDQESRMGYLGADPKEDRNRRYLEEAMRDYNVQKPAEVPVNLSALLLQKEERYQREIFHRRFGELQARFERQEACERALGILFPQVAIQLASSALAATDFAAERWQLNEADAYWDRLTSKVYADVVVRSGPEGKMEAVGPEYWQQFPRFQSALPATPYSLQNAGLPLAAMLAWAGIAWWANRAKTSTAAEEEEA